MSPPICAAVEVFSSCWWSDPSTCACLSVWSYVNVKPNVRYPGVPPSAQFVRCCSSLVFGGIFVAHIVIWVIIRHDLSLVQHPPIWELCTCFMWQNSQVVVSWVSRTTLCWSLYVPQWRSFPPDTFVGKVDLKSFKRIEIIFSSRCTAAWILATWNNRWMWT